MGSAERRKRENAETRQKILDAARDLFVQKGYKATSMRAIADRIEYTPTAIYHHFKNKEALLTELCNQDFRAFAAALQRIAKVEDVVDRIEQMGAAYVDFALEYPMHYQLMFMTVRPGTERDGTQGDPSENAYAFLRITVEEAIAKGRFRPEYSDADQVALMLWGVLHGPISLYINWQDDERIDFGNLRATVIEAGQVMIRGLQS